MLSNIFYDVEYKTNETDYWLTAKSGFINPFTCIDCAKEYLEERKKNGVVVTATRLIKRTIYSETIQEGV